jgi:hypothetical protein
VNPTIKIRPESNSTSFADLSYLDEDDNEDEDFEEDEFEPGDDLQHLV